MYRGILTRMLHVNQDEKLQLRLSRIVRLIADFQLERAGEMLRFEAARQGRRVAGRNDDRGAARLDAPAASVHLVEDEPLPAAIRYEKTGVQRDSGLNRSEILLMDVDLQAR